MNINELEELAKAVTDWGNCNKAWLDNSEDVSVSVVGHISEDGETYPVATVDCDQYYAGKSSLPLAKFYAASNPSAILELIAAYREAVAALDKVVRISDRKHDAWDEAKEALATAKRLGVE